MSKDRPDYVKLAGEIAKSGEELRKAIEKQLPVILDEEAYKQMRQQAGEIAKSGEEAYRQIRQQANKLAQSLSTMQEAVETFLSETQR